MAKLRAMVGGITWMHPGDTVTFILVDISCSATNNSQATATPTPNCTAAERAKTAPQQLIDVVVLKLGDSGKDGVIPLLVAIPTDENTSALSLLKRDNSSIIACPEVNVPPRPTTTVTKG